MAGACGGLQRTSPNHRRVLLQRRQPAPARGAEVTARNPRQATANSGVSLCRGAEISVECKVLYYLLLYMQRVLII